MGLCRRCLLLLLFGLFHALPGPAQPGLPDSARYSRGSVTEDPAAGSEAGRTDDANTEGRGAVKATVYNSSVPDESAWQHATGKDAYGYRDKKEFVQVREQEPAGDPGWIKALIRFFNFLRSQNGQILLWTCFVLIVGYVLYRVIAGQGGSLFGRRDRKRPSVEAPGEITEEGLLENDWEGKLREAQAAGDSRLAIRFSYMHLLQSLQLRGLIAYRPDKTDSTYFHELPENMKTSFRAILRQYEYAWYGCFLPEKPAMDTYMQAYEGMKTTISRA